MTPAFFLGPSPVILLKAFWFNEKVRRLVENRFLSSEWMRKFSIRLLSKKEGYQLQVHRVKLQGSSSQPKMYGQFWRAFKVPYILGFHKKYKQVHWAWCLSYWVQSLLFWDCHLCQSWYFQVWYLGRWFSCCEGIEFPLKFIQNNNGLNLQSFSSLFSNSKIINHLGNLNKYGSTL